MSTNPRRSRAVRFLAPVACVAALGALTACGGDDDASPVATEPAGGGTVTVSDAWARTSAASQTTGAVYFVLTGGAEDDALTAVSVPAEVAAEAQIHETVMSDAGMTDDTAMTDETMMSQDSMAPTMSMQEVDSVAVPAGETVTFEPGGYHVMLMELAAPLEAGTTFDAVLTFEKAGDVTVTVEVRDE